MVYLVTGGAGFIGSHLVEALTAWGDRVVVLDDLSTGKRANLPNHPNVELVQGCVTNTELVASIVQKAKGVFHLAAIASVARSHTEWEWTHQVNQSATVQLLAQCAKQARAVPVVYASSAAVYGDNADLPLSENALLSPLSAYGVDKLGCEMHAKIAAMLHGVSTLGLRFFNVYGARQDAASPYAGVISKFMDAIGAGQSVTVYGDGLQSRDFIHVSDVVRALCAAMSHVEGTRGFYDVVNVCTGSSTTLLGLIKEIEHVAGQKVSIVHEAARAGDIRASCGDVEKMHRLLGVEAEKDMREGLGILYASLHKEAAKIGVAS